MLVATASQAMHMFRCTMCVLPNCTDVTHVKVQRLPGYWHRCLLSPYWLQVAETIQQNSEEIQERRYGFPVGKLMGEVNVKTILTAHDSVS